MNDPTKAVFLSYAREDTDAARRIADALRSQGLEVWFDQNELVGGDTWDAKIRGQINSCALFVPVISANTQARLEGYFRLEWKLAEDRSHLMAKGKAFIMPVGVDATAERGAQVPDAFLKVQWTRLTGGEATPAFVERVKGLMSKQPFDVAQGRQGAGSKEQVVGASLDDARGRPQGTPLQKNSVPGWTWGAVTAVVIGVGVALYVSRQPAAPVAASASEPKPAPANLSPPASRLSPASAPADAKSVAVLAFANLSDDKGSEYFSDGISEELLNVLAKVPGLKVSARTSAFYFKGKNVPIPDIAKQLGVAYVVEGSVQRAGDRVKITAQLIKAADGFHVWSESYTRDMKDIFSVQDEIAGKIASSLTDKLGMAVAAAAKTTPEAYTLYLQARATLAKRGVDNLKEAARQFEGVVALDPKYLPARSGLALTLALIPTWSRTIALGENQKVLDRAKQEARLVIEREPGNAEAWSALGYIYGIYDWRWQEAAEAVARSLELAPNDAEIANFAGDYYRYVLAVPQVVEMESRAVELNPLQAINHNDLGFAYLALRRYELALVPGRMAVSLKPEQMENSEGLVRAYGALKRFEEMRAVLAAARHFAPANSAVMQNMEILGAIFEGRTNDALRLQEEFLPQVVEGGYSPAEYGYHYLLLGQPEKAAHWLKLGIQGHDMNLVCPEVIDFDVIAAHPETRSLLEEPGLKELRDIRARNARAAKEQP